MNEDTQVATMRARADERATPAVLGFLLLLVGALACGLSLHHGVVAFSDATIHLASSHGPLPVGAVRIDAALRLGTALMILVLGAFICMRSRLALAIAWTTLAVSTARHVYLWCTVVGVVANRQATDSAAAGTRAGAIVAWLIAASFYLVIIRRLRKTVCEEHGASPGRGARPGERTGGVRQAGDDQIAPA